MELERRRFSSFDGTPIAFTAVGPQDAPVMLLANGLGGTAEAFIPLIERLPRLRFVSWDYRGLYESGRPLRGYAGLDIIDHARDALALLDHLSAAEVSALGWSMGVQVVLEAVRLEPARMRSLVLLGGVAGRPYQTLANSTLSARVMPRLLRGLKQRDAMVARLVRLCADTDALVPVLIRLGLCHHDLDRDVFRAIARRFRELDMHLYLELLEKLGAHDATDLLPHIEQPALVIVGSADLLTPLGAAEALARGMKNAELCVIPNGSHYAAVEMPELVARRIAAFLCGAAALPPREAGERGHEDAAEEAHG